MFATAFALKLGVIDIDGIMNKTFAATGEAYLSASENLVMLK